MVPVGERETNEDVVRRYAAASASGDPTAVVELRHPGWSAVWPQSGEVVGSHGALVEILRNYPGGAPRTEVTKVVGAEDRWVVTPANTVARVAGSGDFWWCEWRTTYPDGITYICVDLIELQDGLVLREFVYWAPLFDAPSWRTPWVDVVTADRDVPTA
jgi:hypothetical protein